MVLIKLLEKKHSNFQPILSEPSLILIIFYILLECKSKKQKNTILELKNPYEQIFLRHPVLSVLNVPAFPQLDKLSFTLSMSIM